MPIDVAKTIAGLDILSARVDEAVHEAVSEALALVQHLGQVNAPVGVPGNSTNPPGDLAASIFVTGPTGSGGIYSGLVGPTTVYGRQRELGGDIYPGRFARSIGAIDHPEGTGAEPGAYVLAFTIFGNFILTQHVYQSPEPYMLPSYIVMRDRLWVMTADRVARAIASS